MRQNRNFVYVTLSDFILRAGYQMGKTPLLPIFAASLGATDALLGFIVSVSTLTGMVLKPFIGVLSDRWGRRWWLILGTAWFAAMPFLYQFVQTSQQLVALRIVHGLATAIYGPVTLAYITEISSRRKAERLGWFDMARSGGYIVGPALAGWLLLFLPPEDVFTIVGLMSLVAFVPVLALTEPDAIRVPRQVPVRAQIAAALRAGSRTPAIWLSGGLEGTVYVALYAAKAFLPIFALSTGVSVAVVGLFFSLQEATALLLKPLGGRAGDRFGFLPAIALGMGVIAAALLVLPSAQGNLALLALALFIGSGQALVYPSTTALVSTQIDTRHVGAGMGLAGALENFGKVLGPVLGGFLIAWLDYGPMFRWMGGMLLVAAVAVWLGAQRGAARGRSSRGGSLPPHTPATPY